MSAAPVTMLVARRVPRERFHEFRAWLHEGELLAADFAGYLGSGVLAPPPD
ncbi:MAG: antibiotic biosynthesis monooxygenase, partial [Pseudomonas sp.]